jgi:hypothetical protein
MMHDFLPKEMQTLIPLQDKFQEAVIMIDDMNHYVQHKDFCTNIESLVLQLKPHSKLEYYQSSNQNIFLVSY